MSEINIPEEDRTKVSTRIDTLAHDILKKLSIQKYGSSNNMSAVITEAVRFEYAPTPTQRVAREKYANDIDVYPREAESNDSKVIHWRAPTDLVEGIDVDVSNRQLIESAVYDYEAYYTEMDSEFSATSSNEEEVVDWDVMEDNYSQNLTQGGVSGATVPSKPAMRRPFIYSLIDNEGISSFDAFSNKYYDFLGAEYDVSGLPQTETRRKDWKALIDQKHLIPTPSKKTERPMETIDQDLDDDEQEVFDTEAYYPKRVLDNEDNPLEEILEAYIEDMESWINTRAESGTTYETTNAVFKRRENTLSVISNYEIRELEEYADQANELQKRMVEELVEIPD